MNHMRLQVFCQSAAIQSLYIQIPLYMCLLLCVNVLHACILLFHQQRLSSPDPPSFTARPFWDNQLEALLRQEDSIFIGFWKRTAHVTIFYLSEHMAVCFPFLPAGKGRSGPFPSLFPLSLGWRAGWEPGTSASSLSWVSGRMGRARDEQHEVWSGPVNSAACAVFCGEVSHVKVGGGYKEKGGGESEMQTSPLSSVRDLDLCVGIKRSFWAWGFWHCSFKLDPQHKLFSTLAMKNKWPLVTCPEDKWYVNTINVLC